MKHIHVLRQPPLPPAAYEKARPDVANAVRLRVLWSLYEKHLVRTTTPNATIWTERLP